MKYLSFTGTHFSIPRVLMVGVSIGLLQTMNTEHTLGAVLTMMAAFGLGNLYTWLRSQP